MSFIFNHKKKILFFILLVILLVSMGDKKNDQSSGQVQIEDKKGKDVVSSDTGSDKKSVSEIKMRGSRIIGISLNNGSTDFNSAFYKAKETGFTTTEIPVHWSDIESSRGEYKDEWLSIAKSFYPQNGVNISLSLNPIDTNNLKLPAYIKDKPFNDPEVVERFKAFIDFNASLLSGSRVLFVSVGNEIDRYLGGSDKKWKEYTDFYSQVAPYVKAKFPGAIVGTKITQDSIFKNEAKSINTYSDVILLTYYPLKSDITVSDPSVVNDFFKKITETYPGKKIYFAEIGYPSSEQNNSSEEKQAEFIRQTFIAWDNYRDNITMMNFVWLHDISQDSVSGFAKYYGVNDKKFASYLGSLGLRTYDNKDKKAFVVLKEESKKRGW